MPVIVGATKAARRLMNFAQPPEWSGGSLQPAARFQRLSDWQVDLRGKADDAYSEAARLSPSDWQPLERIAGLLFVEDECDTGRRFIEAATLRASSTSDSRVRSDAERELGAARLAADLCEKLEARRPRTEP